MKIKLFCLYLFVALAFAAPTHVLAGGSGSSLDDPSSADTGSHAGYLNDLNKLIEKSSENIKEVNEDIQEQAVLKHSQEREEKAREYYRKGTELANEGKLDEARDYFEKAIRLTEHPVKRTAYPKENQLREREQEDVLSAQKRENYDQVIADEINRKKAVETAYKEAVALYKRKKYHPAKDAFEHINKISPDYRATRSYLKIIARDIAAAESLEAGQQARQIKKQQDEDAAVRAREKEVSVRNKAVQQEQQHALEEKERLVRERQTVAEEKERVARERQSLEEEKKRLAAQQRQAEEKARVDQQQQKLAEEKERVARERQSLEEEKERLAAQQRQAEEKARADQQQRQAAEEHQKVVQEQQRRQQEADRKKEEARQQRELQVKEKQRKRELQEQVRSLYRAAVDLFNKKSIDEALEKFNLIESLYPDYKSTRDFIIRIKKWQADRTREAEDQQRHLLESQKASQLQEQQQKAAADERRRAQELKEGQADKQRQERLAQEHQRVQELKDKADQTEKIYAAALGLYRGHQYEPAKAQFLKVKDRDANYKSTQYYLTKIDGKIKEALEDKQRQEDLARQRQRAQELRDKLGQTEKAYALALNLYRDHQWDRSKAQFLSVEEMSPDYKHTRRYLQKIEVYIAKAASDQRGVFVPFAKVPAVVPAATAVALPVQSQVPVAQLQNVPSPVAIPAPVVEVPAPVVKAPAPVIEPPAPSSFHVNVSPVQPNTAVSIEDQKKQAQEIADLAEKSAKLYRQIADIADDSSTVQTKRKMAQVDEILFSLKDSKERLLRQLQDEKFKGEQKELKERIKQRKAEIAEMYRLGRQYMSAHDYAKAKIKFLELENIAPDYRSTRRYLRDLEDDIKRAGIEAVTSHEQKEAVHLKQLQDKESTEETRRTQADEDRQQKIEQQQQASLKELAGKASDINDDIIRLSRTQDYEGMKVKFTELENTVAALKALKEAMARQRESREHDKQLARESREHRNEILKAEKRIDSRIYAYEKNQSYKENRLLLSGASLDADPFKRREIMREQNKLFSEGVDRYEHKKYTQAKLLFGELANMHDNRAEAWLKKVDRAIARELLRGEAREAGERTAFIADQIKAQRDLIIIQERERQRQKKLTEELERQKRLFEDNRLLQLRKEETMKFQENERQRQEQKRLQLQKESEKEQEDLRFHRIKAVVNTKPEVKSLPQPSPKEPPAPAQPAVVLPPVKTAVVAAPVVLTPAQLQAQKNEEDRQARIKAQAEAREKIKEERQREKERQESLKAEREKARVERIAQEKKRREEALRQREQEREEKIRQKEIIREEARKKEEQERQDLQRQAQLEAQRAAVRRQLEDGVEVMYQEALKLYKQGEYSSAADRFKDVQDIIPGYKRSGPYMDEARLKSLAVKPQPPASDVLPKPSVVSRQDSVSRALDLFDTNAK